MENYRYLILGGGMCADSAVRGIREIDPNGSIGIIGAELSPPYNRPPLSKKLWKGGPFESIWRHTEQLGVTLHLGHRGEVIDVQARQVSDEAGTVYGYSKLLLATGGTPRRLDLTSERVIYYRTVDDYRQLRTLTEPGKRFGVVGGGFIGWEMAAALAMNQKQVLMVFPAEGIGTRIFPRDLSQFLLSYYRDKGVEVMGGRSVVDIQSHGEGVSMLVRELESSAESDLQVDGVVAGIGLRLNTELAEHAGLRVENGIVVDELLCTSHPDIYAAGDIANFYSPQLGMRMRVEHEDNANTMGRYAGRNMAGAREPYHYLPMFYSDLFDMGFEAVGDISARLNCVAEWKEPFQKGVLYYMHSGRVRGVLLWNVWEKVEEARKLIAEPGPFDPMDLKGRL